HRWYGVDWNEAPPYQYVVFDPVAQTATRLTGPANSGDEYGNGNWIQHPADLNDQWALFSHFEGLAPPAGDGWLAPGGMVFVTANGQRRLLGHPYTTIGEAASYALASFVRLSSDGRYAMFTSDMNGSGREDGERGKGEGDGRRRRERSAFRNGCRGTPLGSGPLAPPTRAVTMC